MKTIYVIIVGMLMLASGCAGFFVGQYVYAKQLAAMINESIDDINGSRG